MILVLEKSISQEQISQILNYLEQMKFKADLLKSSDSFIVCIESDVRTISSHIFSQLNGVEKVIRLQEQTKLVHQKTNSLIKIGKHNCSFYIGTKASPILIAGPCSVESPKQIKDLAFKIKASGALALRGGAFKPRTNPYEFQGLGKDAFLYLKEASLESELPVISEVLSPNQIEIAEDCLDMIQVGARNMYNYELLKELGKSKLPILLKRGISASINEWLNAAEYIMSNGNESIVLCERGIRTFEKETRNTLDLSAIPIVKEKTGLAVIVDPSHATGRADLIVPMSRAAIASGADGLIIEVHETPAKSYSDSEQAIEPCVLKNIAQDMKNIFQVLNPDSNFSTNSNLVLNNDSLNLRLASTH